MIIFVFFQSKETVFLKSAIDCARTIISRTIIRDKTEPMQIVNIQPDKTVNNEPAIAAPGSLELITQLENFEDVLVNPEEPLPDDTEEVKLSYAIKVTLHVIQKYNKALNERDEDKPKRGGRKKIPPPTKVIMFTTLQNAEIPDKTVTNLIEAFKEHSITLYLMVPAEKSVYTLNENSTLSDLKKAMENPMLFPFELTELQKLLIDSEGLICNVKFGSSLFEVHKPKKLPAAWNVNLRIGSDTKILIPVIGYRKSMDFEFPTWKYTKHGLPEEADVEEPNSKKQKMNEEAIAEKEATENIKMEANSEDLLDEYPALMDLHATSGGPVYLTKEEKNAHKPPTEKCLDLLFTIDRDEINALFCVDSPVRLLFPKNQAFSPIYQAFRQALIKNKAAGVARYCYMKNVYPKLVALIPHSNSLQMFQVPYKDYITDPIAFIQSKKRLFTDPLEAELSPEQIKVIETQKKKLDPEMKKGIDDFLSAMTITDDDCVERLPVQLTVNPVLDFLHEITVERARKEDSEVDLSRLRLPIVHFDRAHDALDELLKIF